MSFFRLCVAAVLITAPLAPASAQTPPAASREGWSQQQMIDLAAVLGGAHYLRITCDGRGDQRWRNYARDLIARAPDLRRPLSDAFNDGYRDQAARFPDCSPTAQQVEAELRARGLRIASALSAHNGN
ncbi:MAG: TIGR02301 family protein [Hyphomonadaceae bacterium]